jgi:hypothetical protein
MSGLPTKKYNPYLAMTPCCGDLVCLKCMEIVDNINSAAEGKGDPGAQRYANQQHKRLERHLAMYDHTLLDHTP